MLPDPLRWIFTAGQVYLVGILISGINFDALRSHPAIVPQVVGLQS
jgi:ABC-type multidrug transport system fused ATPase/permease subunit